MRYPAAAPTPAPMSVPVVLRPIAWPVSAPAPAPAIVPVSRFVSLPTMNDARQEIARSEPIGRTAGFIGASVVNGASDRQPLSCAVAPRRTAVRTDVAML